MSKVGKQHIEGSEQVRVYHSTLLLADRGIPVIVGNASEVAHILFLAEQRSTVEAVAAGLPAAVASAIVQPHPRRDIHAIVDAVLEFDGVAYAAAVGYQLIVVKGKLFDWGPIEDKLLLLLAGFNLSLESSRIVEVTKDAES